MSQVKVKVLSTILVPREGTAEVREAHAGEVLELDEARAERAVRLGHAEKASKTAKVGVPKAGDEPAADDEE